jgi:hypothetical protein
MFIVIPISSLKPSDVGRWVVYSACPGHVECGRIKSWSDRFIYVVFRCGEDWDAFEQYTAAPTRQEDIEFDKNYSITSFRRQRRRSAVRIEQALDGSTDR